MKKYTATTLLIFAFLSLTACDPVAYEYFQEGQAAESLRRI